MEQKIAIFVDYTAIARRSSEFLEALLHPRALDFFAFGGEPITASIFVPVDPHSLSQIETVTNGLWDAGWLVVSKVGVPHGSDYRCPFFVETTHAVLKAVYEQSVDTVVISVDSPDYIPLIKSLRDMGVFVVLAGNAAFPIEIRRHSNTSLNIDRFFDFIDQPSEPEDEDGRLRQIHRAHYTANPNDGDSTEAEEDTEEEIHGATNSQAERT